MRYLFPSNLLLACFLSVVLFNCQSDDDLMSGMMDDDTMVEPESGDSTVINYFPPLDNSLDWESKDPTTLGWNEPKLTELLDYLEEKNTKGFIILKDGRIVVEEYFNGHDENKNWNWFSAAKSLTSTLVGVSEMEGFIDLEEKSSTYLGNNWSLLDKEKQDLIKVKNHITMTTGLRNPPAGQLIQWTCTAPICMQYEVDAGEKWAYHQGAFTLSQNIITKATGQNFKLYLREKILDKIGMNGSWNEILDIRIFSSTTRSMARFGLLAINEGKWEEETIYPQDYHNAMVNSSQSINEAYGYLWWLNGKNSFMTTADQTVLTGPLIPNAPNDMYAALGAEDQKIYIIPSQDMVIVRCGEPAGNIEFANSSFNNELWGLIQEVIP